MSWVDGNRAADLEPRAAWRVGLVAIADAVTFADGRMVLFEMLQTVNCPERFHQTGETTFGAFLAKTPGWLAEVTQLVELTAPSVGALLAGEGPQGADGFISLSDADGELTYCIFCTSSNPFEKLSIDADGLTVRAVTTTGVEWSFRIDSPSVVATRFHAG